MTMPNDTRITYVRDAFNDERVLTIVHRLNTDNTITYGFSVNRPSEWKQSSLDNRGRTVCLYKSDGDQFSKHQGKAIAFARLDNPRSAVTIPRVDGVAPIMSVLQHLTEGSNRHVARVARYEYEYRLLTKTDEDVTSIING